MSTTKQCSKCKEIKPRTEFYARKRSSDGLRPHCKVCHSSYSGSDKHKAYMRDWHNTPKGKWRGFKNKAKAAGFPVTSTREEFIEAMSVNSCEVCGVELTQNRKDGTMKCIDHCHDTGQIRGTLCMKCNSAEGYLKTVDNVRNLLNYLTKDQA